jgi:hypothetical protein
MEYTRYSGHKTWPSKTTSMCLHCGGPIKYRPIPVATAQLTDVAYRVEGTMCSFPCLRAYATYMGLTLDRNFISAMDYILSQFKRLGDDYDDPEYKAFLTDYDRFMCIPEAPARSRFARFSSGNLTDEEAKRQLIEAYTSSKRESYLASMVSATFGTRR